MTIMSGLFCHLAADFTARIGRGMDVDIIFAGLEVGGLGVRQRGAAFNRTGLCIWDRNSDGSILAGFGRPVEVGGGRRTGQAGIGELQLSFLVAGS